MYVYAYVCICMCLYIWMCAVCIVHVQDTYTNVYVHNRIHIRMYTARTCTCMHTCTHTFIPWSARVRSFLRASSSACALALLFVASCAQSPLCVCERECVCVSRCVCVYVCGECNRDHHSEFLRAGMHAPPASCQRELTLGTKSRQREEASDGLKHGSGVFYYCRTYYKAVRVGGEESGGHVL